MRRVVFNLKGGVGKTSITCNLAAEFAQRGRKVLIIDLDSQANSSHYLLPGRSPDSKSIYDFFESTLSFKLFKDSLAQAVHPTAHEGLFVVPACAELGDIQSKLENRYKIMKLSQALDIVISNQGFDDVFIDTPPALNFYSMSALLSADSVLIPFDCDEFSVQGIEQVVSRIYEVKDDYRPDLHVEGVIVNNFQAQAKLPQATIDSLRDKGFTVLKPFLSSSVIMKESHARHKPLIHLRKSHKLTAQFGELAKRLLATSESNRSPRARRPKNRRPVQSAKAAEL